jgi:N-acetyl-D-muramate 6-phosphate phosphatase
MQYPQAILFDLDGTLLDTARDLGNALNAVLRDKKLPEIHYDEYRPIASNGAKGMLELGFGDLLVDYDFEQLRQQFLKHYQQNICADTIAFDGVDVLIEQLILMNIPWGVVTNKPATLTNELLAKFKLFEHCQVVVSGDTLAERKPHPAPLLHAADIISIKPEQIWYVGDAERDIQAAKAAGMTSVLAEYGYIEAEDNTADWQADFSISHASELLTHLN